jgi:hypothetical protein
VPVCLLVAKVQKIFQIIDGYARFLRERNKNKRRETEAEDVGAAIPEQARPLELVRLP